MYARSTGYYDHIRYIDAAGMEVVRVDRNAGNPRVLASHELQRKDHRDYFEVAAEARPRRHLPVPAGPEHRAWRGGTTVQAHAPAGDPRFRPRRHEPRRGGGELSRATHSRPAKRARARSRRPGEPAQHRRLLAARPRARGRMGLRVRDAASAHLRQRLPAAVADHSGTGPGAGADGRRTLHVSRGRTAGRRRILFLPHGGDARLPLDRRFVRAFRRGPQSRSCATATN